MRNLDTGIAAPSIHIAQFPIYDRSWYVSIQYVLPDWNDLLKKLLELSPIKNGLKAFVIDELFAKIIYFKKQLSMSISVRIPHYALSFAATLCTLQYRASTP